MKKRWLFFSIFASLISFISFTSAQSALIDSITSGISPQTVTLAILFIVFFLVLNFSTSKIFKGNKTVSTIISLALSLLIIYWINQSASVGNLFSGIGISGDNLYTIGAILIVAFSIFLFVKIKSLALFVIGGILILVGVMGWVYETSTVILIGIISVVVGIFFAIVKKKRGGSTPSVNPNVNNITHNNYYQIEKNKEKKIENEKKELGQERDMAARAKAMAVAEADYAQHEASVNAQRRRQIEAETQQQQNLQKQITSNLGSLKQTYNQLQMDYDNIQKQNRDDPQLRDIFDEMVNVRNEIKRLLNR